MGFWGFGEQYVTGFCTAGVLRSVLVLLFLDLFVPYSLVTFYTKSLGMPGSQQSLSIIIHLKNPCDEYAIQKIGL